MDKNDNGASERAFVPAASDPQAVPPVPASIPDAEETQERRARRLFDEMARNIGREAVNYMKRMYPEIFTDYARNSKSWETSMTNHIRNDINWRMRPLLMALIAMHHEWTEE